MKISMWFFIFLHHCLRFGISLCYWVKALINVLFKLLMFCFETQLVIVKVAIFIVVVSKKIVSSLCVIIHWKKISWSKSLKTFWGEMGLWHVEITNNEKGKCYNLCHLQLTRHRLLLCSYLFLQLFFRGAPSWLVVHGLVHNCKNMNHMHNLVK
jgi:hypothetical protein